jgi:hypothetical protein
MDCEQDLEHAVGTAMARIEPRLKREVQRCVTDTLSSFPAILLPTHISDLTG